MKTLGKFLIVTIALIASFFFGSILGRHSVKFSISNVQSTINFGHLQAYTDLESDISANCTSRALARLEMMINGQKILISEHLQEYDDVELKEYISLRNSGLVEELKSNKFDRRYKWTLPGCDE